MVRVTDAFLNTLLQPVVMLDILDFFTLVRDRSCVLLAWGDTCVTDVTVLVCQVAFLTDTVLVVTLLTFKRLFYELVLKNTGWLALLIVNGGGCNFLRIDAFGRLSVLYYNTLAPLLNRPKRIMWHFWILDFVFLTCESDCCPCLPPISCALLPWWECMTSETGVTPDPETLGFYPAWGTPPL